MNRIEMNLAESRNLKMNHGNLWFNVLCFLIVIGSALTFMITQYHSAKMIIQPVNIPKTDLIWNNSIRNRLDM